MLDRALTTHAIAIHLVYHEGHEQHKEVQSVNRLYILSFCYARMTERLESLRPLVLSRYCGLAQRGATGVKVPAFSFAIASNVA
jgi:hypothetical protein